MVLDVWLSCSFALRYGEVLLFYTSCVCADVRRWAEPNGKHMQYSICSNDIQHLRQIHRDNSHVNIICLFLALEIHENENFYVGFGFWVSAEEKVLGERRRRRKIFSSEAVFIILDVLLVFMMSSARAVPSLFPL